MSEIQADPYKLRGNLRTILEQLDPTKLLDNVDTAPEGSYLERSRPGEFPALDRMWFPWTEFNNATIEALLGPVLDDVISEWPRIRYPARDPPYKLEDETLGRIIHKSLGPTINRIIRYICLKLLNVAPVLMRLAPPQNMIDIEEYDAEGCLREPTQSMFWPHSAWLNERFGNGVDPLPGLNRSTRESKLKDIFENCETTPGSDISKREEDDWLHARTYFGEIVHYANFMRSRYFFVITSWELIVGQISGEAALNKWNGIRHVIKEPHVELQRIPFQNTSEDGVKGFALALVFLHVLASVDNSVHSTYEPLSQSEKHRLLIHAELEKKAGKVGMSWMEMVEREEKLSKLYKKRKATWE